MSTGRRNLHGPLLLEGEAVVLRELLEGDVSQDYVDWMNDPEVVRYTESRFSRHTLESTRQFVTMCRKDENSLLLGIFSREGGLHVGNIKLGPINWYHGSGDIGLIVGRKSSWGKGIATQAISLLAGHAFSTLGLNKITAGCYALNQGSVRAFLKAGFKQEGTREKHVRLEDSRIDVIEFGLVNPRPDEG